MKVYRYPSTSPFDKVLVDEKDLAENIKDDFIDFDISLDKYAERKSGVRVKFDLKDYAALQIEIIQSFEKEIARLNEECLKLSKRNEELVKIIPISIRIMEKAYRSNFSKEDVDYMKHCFESNSRANPQLMVTHLDRESDLKEAYRILERISQSPWEMK